MLLRWIEETERARDNLVARINILDTMSRLQEKCVCRAQPVRVCAR